jgi:hypothetical protein
VEKKMKTAKRRDEVYPEPTTFQQEVLAAAKKSAAAETSIAEEIREYIGEPETGREGGLTDPDRLLISLDGPEDRPSSNGYPRPFFPARGRERG